MNVALFPEVLDIDPERLAAMFRQAGFVEVQRSAEVVYLEHAQSGRAKVVLDRSFSDYQVRMCEALHLYCLATGLSFIQAIKRATPEVT